MGKTETKLGNANLRKYFESNYDPDLEKVVKWTEEVNKDINDMATQHSSIPECKAVIAKISSFADVVIVSQTPLEALEREWQEHRLKGYVKLIAGQEHGTKTEHIAFAAKGKYPDNKILMIGDAKGDLDAAKNNGILFYPDNTGEEKTDHGNVFLMKPLKNLKNVNYAGAYENELLKEFRKSLPETPPWL